MSYPITTPTPTGLAPLHPSAVKVQVQQFIESSGPGLYSSNQSTPLNNIAITGL